MRLNDRVQVLLDLAYCSMDFRHVDLSVLHRQRKVLGLSGMRKRGETVRTVDAQWQWHVRAC
jgi:hypothetical protein